MAVLLENNRSDAVPSESVASFVYALIEDDIFSFNHGFATKPRQCEAYIRCITAELGYEIGDEVEISNSSELTLAVNNTEVKVSLASVPTIVADTNTATAVTAANWDLVLKFEL